MKSEVTKLCDLGPDDGLCSVQCTREGSYLSIGSNPGEVQVTRMGMLAWSSRVLSSGSRDRNILQHDLRVSSDFVSKLLGHRSEVCRLKWSHDDRELASGGNDNQLLVCNQHATQPVLKFTQHTAAVKAIYRMCSQLPSEVDIVGGLHEDEVTEMRSCVQVNGGCVVVLKNQLSRVLKEEKPIGVGG